MQPTPIDQGSLALALALTRSCSLARSKVHRVRRLSVSPALCNRTARGIVPISLPHIVVTIPIALLTLLCNIRRRTHDLVTIQRCSNEPDVETIVILELLDNLIDALCTSRRSPTCQTRPTRQTLQPRAIDPDATNYERVRIPLSSPALSSCGAQTNQGSHCFLSQPLVIIFPP